MSVVLPVSAFLAVPSLAGAGDQPGLLPFLALLGAATVTVALDLPSPRCCRSFTRAVWFLPLSSSESEMEEEEEEDDDDQLPTSDLGGVPWKEAVRIHALLKGRSEEELEASKNYEPEEEDEEEEEEEEEYDEEEEEESSEGQERLL